MASPFFVTQLSLSNSNQPTSRLGGGWLYPVREGMVLFPSLAFKLPFLLLLKTFLSSEGR